MRFRPPTGVERDSLSPSAHDVLTRLDNGTFELDLECIADAILERLQDEAVEVVSPDAAQSRMPPDGSLSSSR